MSLLTAIQKRANPLENPKVKISDPRVIDYLGGNRSTDAGVVISHEKTLGLPAYWKGFNLICRAVGKTPLVVQRNLDPGHSPAKTHEAYQLLKRRPNADMGAFQFKQTLQGHALNYGNGYAWIRRDATDQLRLDILDPAETVPLRINGNLAYRTKLLRNDSERPEVVTLTPERVLHIRGLGFDGITGYSVIDMLKEALGLPVASRKYGSTFLRRGGRPTWVIEVPWKFKDAEQVEAFRTQVEGAHGNLESSHRPLIFDNGSKANPMAGMTHEDAQLLQSREFDNVELANILLLPPHKIGGKTNTSYKSLEEENQAVLDDAYDPWFVIWEEECEAKLLKESQKRGDTHSIRFKRQAFMRADIQKRGAWYAAMLDRKVFTPNMVLELEDMNPVEWGDEPLVTNNLPDTGTEDDEPDGGDRLQLLAERSRSAVASVVSPLIKRLEHQATNHCQKPTFNKWLEDIPLQAPEFIDRISPVVAAADVSINGSTTCRTQTEVVGLLDLVQHKLTTISEKAPLADLPGQIRAMFNRPEFSGDYFAGLVTQKMLGPRVNRTNLLIEQVTNLTTAAVRSA